MKHTSLTPGTATPSVSEEASGVLGAKSLLLASANTWRCGHPKTPENTRRTGDGEVRCRVCRKVIDERSKQRKAERMSINGIGRPRNGTTASSVTLPWPPASLSGHNKGHWHAKSGIVSKHREWARLATMEAKPAVPADGDIYVSVMFYPPDNRGDRVNFPNRMKPYWDGIADALKVNDRRFLPSFHFALPVRDSRVVVTIGRDA